MATVHEIRSMAGTALSSLDDSGNLTIAGSLTQAGASTGITNLTATGNTSLGDAAADTVTITGHVDIDSARTTAGSGLDIDGTINSASAAFSALDITAVQLTTARTSGTVNGVKAATTSLAGDLNNVVYATYRAGAPTDGGGAAVHAAYLVEAGHDVALDLSACATGEADIVIGDNLAEALVIREAGNAYLTLASTNGSELITAAKRIVASAGIDGVVGGTTPAAVTGTTITANTAFVGRTLTDDAVKATITVGDATGGSADAALALVLRRADNSTAVASARQVLIVCGATQYARQAVDSSPTFGTATAGSIVASGSGWCLAETSAAGAFDCTVSNATDETLYFWVEHPAGVSDLSKACLVIGSTSDAATWSA